MTTNSQMRRATLYGRSRLCRLSLDSNMLHWSSNNDMTGLGETLYGVFIDGAKA